MERFKLLPSLLLLEDILAHGNDVRDFLERMPGDEVPEFHERHRREERRVAGWSGGVRKHAPSVEDVTVKVSDAVKAVVLRL